MRPLLRLLVEESALGMHLRKLEQRVDRTNAYTQLDAFRVIAPQLITLFAPLY